MTMAIRLVVGSVAGYVILDIAFWNGHFVVCCVLSTTISFLFIFPFSLSLFFLCTFNMIAQSRKQARGVLFSPTSNPL